MDATVHLSQVLAARRDKIADAWYKALAPTSFVPFSAVEIREHLAGLVDAVCSLLLSPSVDRAAAQDIGVRLANFHFLQPEALGKSQELLARELTRDIEPGHLSTLKPKLIVILSELATGFTIRLREAILAEQEAIRRALLAEREHIETALRNSEASLAEAQRIAHVGHWEYDWVKDELRWSTEVYCVFGVSPAQFRPTLNGFLEFLHADDRQKVQSAVQSAFTGGRFSIDHRIIRPDGQLRVVHEEGEVIPDDTGQPARTVGVVHDITDRKTLESQRYLQEFLAMVSHDLKQPMSVLLGRVQLLQVLVERGESSLNESEQRSLVAIQETARRIERLIQDVQDAVDIGANRFLVQPIPVDLVRVLRGIVEEQQLTTDVHRISLDAPEQLEGRWDPDRISQLFTNLISNAIKYSPDGGDVEVAVRRADDEIIVSVSDQGIGISPENQQQLFQPFSRAVDEDLKVHGRGLGLYISRAIAEAHGGRIWVESERNKGSTFYVALPLYSLGA